MEKKTISGSVLFEQSTIAAGSYRVAVYPADSSKTGLLQLPPVTEGLTPAVHEVEALTTSTWNYKVAVELPASKDILISFEKKAGSDEWSIIDRSPVLHDITANLAYDFCEAEPISASLPSQNPPGKPPKPRPHEDVLKELKEEIEENIPAKPAVNDLTEQQIRYLARDSISEKKRAKAPRLKIIAGDAQDSEIQIFKGAMLRWATGLYPSQKISLRLIEFRSCVAAARGEKDSIIKSELYIRVPMTRTYEKMVSEPPEYVPVKINLDEEGSKLQDTKRVPAAFLYSLQLVFGPPKTDWSSDDNGNPKSTLDLAIGETPEFVYKTLRAGIENGHFKADKQDEEQNIHWSMATRRIFSFKKPREEEIPTFNYDDELDPEPLEETDQDPVYTAESAAQAYLKGGSTKQDRWRDEEAEHWKKLANYKKQEANAKAHLYAVLLIIGYGIEKLPTAEVYKKLLKFRDTVESNKPNPIETIHGREKTFWELIKDEGMRQEFLSKLKKFYELQPTPYEPPGDPSPLPGFGAGPDWTECSFDLLNYV